MRSNPEIRSQRKRREEENYHRLHDDTSADSPAHQRVLSRYLNVVLCVSYP